MIFDMNPLPKVIACVPSYNAEAFIEKTLQSLQNQTFLNFEILISDDCSTDRTVSVIQAFIKEDPRFHLICQEKNLGWVDNVNFLMEKAVEMGEFVFIMPHDDQISPHYVIKLTRILEDNPSAILAFSDIECTYTNQKKMILRYHQIDKYCEKEKQTELLLKFPRAPGIAYRGITRSSKIRNILPLEKNLMGNRVFAMDWIWLIRLSLNGTFIRYPDVLYFKFLQPTSMSVLWRRSSLNVFSVFITCSSVLWKQELPIRKQIRFQSILYLHLAKMLIYIPIYSLMKVLKYGFGKLKKAVS